MTLTYEEAITEGFVGTRAEYIEFINNQIDDQMIQLNDVSGLFVTSTPLPSDHWLYDPTPDVNPNVVLDDMYMECIQTAVKQALRECTGNGTDMDIDPDALVQSVCRILIGTSDVPVLTDRV